MYLWIKINQKGCTLQVLSASVILQSRSTEHYGACFLETNSVTSNILNSLPSKLIRGHIVPLKIVIVIIEIFASDESLKVVRSPVVASHRNSSLLLFFSNPMSKSKCWGHPWCDRCLLSQVGTFSLRIIFQWVRWPKLCRRVFSEVTFHQIAWPCSIIIIPEFAIYKEKHYLNIGFELFSTDRVFSLNVSISVKLAQTFLVSLSEYFHEVISHIICWHRRDTCHLLNQT